MIVALESEQPASGLGTSAVDGNLSGLRDDWDSAEPPRGDRLVKTASRFLARVVPLAVWLLALCMLSAIPLRILSLGYLPSDDALRHAAQAVDPRPWNEVLVIRPEFAADHNPGWHWLLHQVHRTTGLGPEGLVFLSVAGLFGMVLVLPMFGFARPEAWLAALLAGLYTNPDCIYRVFLGRPLAVTIAVTIAVLFLWRDRPAKRPPLWLLAVTTVMLAASTWLHGSWYLFGLVIAAFALAGSWRLSAWLGACWLVGSFLGAALTGHPVSFLLLQVDILRNCFADTPLQRMLVSEYQPTDGCTLAVFLVAALLFWRHSAGAWNGRSIRQPAFVLAVLGWILGLRIGRTFSDWGAPALLLWTALELSERFERLLPLASLTRLGVVAGLSFALFFGLTTDVHSRWTRALDNEYLSASDPEMAPWLPAAGGTLYASDMSLFYQTYFKNPNAPWRYVLGFEPTFMLPDDLRIYRNIQRNFYAEKAYEPWVRKMHPADRLAIRAGSGAAPAIPGLEWHYTARDIWLGRKPVPGRAGLSLTPSAETQLKKGF